MAGSILNDVKKTLGYESTVTDFDLDIIVHINTALSFLTQLGVGPVEGLAIEDDTVAWDSLIGVEPRLELVKTYVYLRVKRLFDPPNTSYLLGAYKEQIEELEWRISVLLDEIASEATV